MKSLSITRRRPAHHAKPQQGRLKKHRSAVFRRPQMKSKSCAAKPHTRQTCRQAFRLIMRK
ncbi:hypothetical protein [Chelonobacter oris]|uniref:hypothetical protein n=1 Tax=Chelonobacter oris TaxID=505317 RepID=UPI00126A5CA4|nr:hypothetical protein [Chelonobacter oris]